MMVFDEQDLMRVIRERGLFPQTPQFWSVIDHLRYEDLSESDTKALLDHWLDCFFNRQSLTPGLRHELHRTIHELLMLNDYRLSRADLGQLFRVLESPAEPDHIGAAIGFLELSYDEAYLPDLEAWLDSPNPGLAKLAADAVDFIRRNARHPARPVPVTIVAAMVLPMIFEVDPAFQTRLAQDIGPDSEPAVIMAEWGRQIDSRIREGDLADLPAMFTLIENLLFDGDSRVSEATETLLEALMQAQTPAQGWVPLLGEWSKSYCRAMDEFMPVRTEGLN